MNTPRAFFPCAIRRMTRAGRSLRFGLLGLGLGLAVQVRAAEDKSPPLSRPFAMGDLGSYVVPTGFGVLFVMLAFGWQRRVTRELGRQAARWRESEEKYRMLVENSHEGIYVVQDGVFRFVNRATERLTGLTQVELLGRATKTLIGPEDWERGASRQRRLLAGESEVERIEFRLVAPHGREIWLTVSGVRIEWQGRPATLNFVSDITERRRAEDELRVRDALHTGIIDSVTDHIAVLDERAVIIAVNRAWRQFAIDNDALGLGTGSVGLNYLEVCGNAPRYPSGDEATAVLVGLSAVLEKRAGIFHLEYPCHAPMEQRWFQLTITPLAGSRSGAVVSHKDVTTRKLADDALQESLREKAALLKEVHHRVKNNLQVVMSLLRLEAGKSRNEKTRAVLQDMQGRIRSMAFLHETLYRSENFARVNLNRYLGQLAMGLFRAHRDAADAVRLELELAPVEMDIDQTIPCGLILNELLSNCLKHGFPDGRAGVVRVELQPVDDGARLRLRVSDDGVGLPADFGARSAQSMGMQLVSDWGLQLEGRLEIGSGPGAVFAFTFSPTRSGPNANVVAP